MVYEVQLVDNRGIQSLNYQLRDNNLIFLENLKLNKAFKIKFTFKESISLVRNHAYKWCTVDNGFSGALLAPKVLQLKNGMFIQGNRALGIWQVTKLEDNVLYWCFNQEYEQPFASYYDKGNLKQIKHHSETIELQDIGLLFPLRPIEFSRSKIPFSAVLSFTDHCDFDTITSLKTMRDFFKKNGIKVTKGFFLRHYSKRSENASFDVHFMEYEKWKTDGHELAYHSLTQSLRKEEDAQEEFSKFKGVKDCRTWIDHGFQPYNLSLADKYGFSHISVIKKLNEKGVFNFWSYIDNGPAQKGVINQLNPKQFTLQNYKKGIENFVFYERWLIMCKLIFFYYFDSSIKRDFYNNTVRSFKQFIKNKSIKYLIPLFKSTTKLLAQLTAIYINFNAHSKKIFPLSKYGTVFFKLEHLDSYIFQTLEMNDFENGLSLSNQDLLIKEAGICILHTYFSVPFNYHKGRFMLNEITINPRVIKNFEYLAVQIKKENIWNPTLNELIDYNKQFYDLKLAVDAKGNIYEISDTNLKRRIIQ